MKLPHFFTFLSLLHLASVNAAAQDKNFNKILAELPRTLPNSHIISSAGCTSNPDRMHFNAAGSREFGKRYGEKMLSLLGQKAVEAK